MGRIIPFKLIWSWGAVALALLAGLSLPRVAQAGCGDYVLIHGKHVPMGHSADPSGAGQMLSHNETAEGAADEPERAPCHGPGCSNGSLPPAAPASEIHVPVDRWAISRGEGIVLVLSAAALSAEPAEPGSDGVGLSILRPPR